MRWAWVGIVAGLVGAVGVTAAASRMPVASRRRRALGDEAGEDRWKAFPVVSPETTDPDGSRRTWGNAAWIDPETREGVCIHVTSDPKRVLRVVRSGEAVAESRDVGKYGDIGPGLYCSAAPQVWYGRAPGKWSFLDNLTRPERLRLAKAVLSSWQFKDSGYLSRYEKERGRKLVGQFVKQYDKGEKDYAKTLFVELAQQPYNIASWKPDFLDPLGIRPGQQPVEVEMRFRGKFIRLERHLDDDETQRMVEESGADGAFEPGGIIGTPQLVVWNTKAVTGFGPFRRPRSLRVLSGARRRLRG